MTLTLGYAELAAEVGDYLGLGRSGWSSLPLARIDSCIKSGLRQVYYPSEFKPGITHQWSFMRPEATIETTAPSDSSTVTVALGVVTLASGAWPAWAAEGELHISSATYTVKTRDSDTQLTLDDLTVTAAAGTTYTLSRPSYDLPEGFDGNFDGNLHYKTGDNTLWPAIRFLAPEGIRRKKQNYSDTDRPLYAAIQPKEFTATVGQRWQITFYPSPNAAYTLYGRYKVRPAMIDSTNLYPLGGTAMAEVFLASCLAVAEKRFVEESQVHQSEFLRLLQAAIDHDADAFSADFLGYNADRSEEGRLVDDLDRRTDDATHSYEGVVYYD